VHTSTVGRLLSFRALLLFLIQIGERISRALLNLQTVQRDLQTFTHVKQASAIVA